MEPRKLTKEDIDKVRDIEDFRLEAMRTSSLFRMRLITRPARILLSRNSSRKTVLLTMRRPMIIIGSHLLLM